MTFEARETRSSACPHDCPSTCALEVEVLDGRRIGAVRGAEANSYTRGVVCAKVARYAERIHHPERLTTPLLRTGPKGSGQFRPIGWEEALDRVAEAFIATAHKHGAEAVWPYYYAGTMGLVQRDGINRLRHVMRYARQKQTICTATCEAGWIAGVGRVHRPRPARNGEIRPDRRLGRQSGRHPGERDGTHHPRSQGARGEARRGRSVPDRDGAGGRPPSRAAPGHGRRAGLRRDAYRVSGRICRPRLHGAIRRLPRRAGDASAIARTGMGQQDHRAFGGDDRGIRQALLRDGAQLYPHGIRVFPLPQRRGESVRGELPADGHGRLAP